MLSQLLWLLAQKTSGHLFNQPDKEESLSIYGTSKRFEAAKESGLSRLFMTSPNHKLHNLTLVFLVSVSFFGLILTVLLALHPPILEEDLVWRKPVAGSAFGAVCILGTLAVFSPNACSRFFGFKRSASISHATASTLRGHHPVCGRFSAHVFRLDGRVFCATCSGLFLGALISLFGLALYFFGNWQMGQNAFLAVLVGSVGVIFGLLQSPLSMLQNSVIRLFSSAFFVVGTFLILEGVEELAHSVSIDLFLVVLSVFWLMTRISLSQWDHERVCSKCTLDSCSFAG
jgi:hypothetical protein